MFQENVIKSLKGVSRIFQKSFVLQFCCSMNLIAATRAEGGLVLLGCYYLVVIILLGCYYLVVIILLLCMKYVAVLAQPQLLQDYVYTTQHSVVQPSHSQT